MPTGSGGMAKLRFLDVFFGSHFCGIFAAFLAETPPII